MIKDVVICANGMVLVFDEAGEQMGNYQGRVCDVLRRILKDAPETARFRIGDYNTGCYVNCLRAALEAFAEQFPEALPDTRPHDWKASMSRTICRRCGVIQNEDNAESACGGPMLIGGRFKTGG